jgi:uncharacterized surface protein with fasciclin (FAS1) repeats
LTSGEVTTIGGSTAQVDVDGGTIAFDGATVVRPDITASNGVAHGIDAVPNS